MFRDIIACLERGRHNVFERETTWLTKRTAHRNPLSTHHLPVHTPARVARRAHVLRVRLALLAQAALAAASSFGARRSASSARRRLTRSLIATFACCRVLWRNGARSFRAV